MKTLFYIHDPMCAWCWGFRPAWEFVCESLGDDWQLQYVLGGLAPDSDAMMDEPMRQYIQDNWRRIEQCIPGTRFNYGFWSDCIPRRSTYPACRAVLAAAQLGAKQEAMILAIQTAYYLEAKNPSDEDVLVECAQSMGLDAASFLECLNSEKTQWLLQENLEFYQHLAAKGLSSGFPSLVAALERDDGVQWQVVLVDYNKPELMVAAINAFG